ncbi:MAG: hypothetical protein M1829_001129 [Trizodia sp. TS-e1964]|nr:MAG: hypothetical protein M1829_001129 [Trizodia sp. TS-e1964]
MPSAGNTFSTVSTPPQSFLLYYWHTLLTPQFALQVGERELNRSSPSVEVLRGHTSLFELLFGPRPLVQPAASPYPLLASANPGATASTPSFQAHPHSLEARATYPLPVTDEPPTPPPRDTRRPVSNIHRRLFPVSPRPHAPPPRLSPRSSAPHAPQPRPFPISSGPQVPPPRLPPEFPGPHAPQTPPPPAHKRSWETLPFQPPLPGALVSLKETILPAEAQEDHLRSVRDRQRKHAAPSRTLLQELLDDVSSIKAGARGTAFEKCSRLELKIQAAIGEQSCSTSGSPAWPERYNIPPPPALSSPSRSRVPPIRPPPIHLLEISEEDPEPFDTGDLVPPFATLPISPIFGRNFF